MLHMKRGSEQECVHLQLDSKSHKRIVTWRLKAGKSSLLDNGSVNTFPRQRTDNTVTDEMLDTAVSIGFTSELQQESSVQKSYFNLFVRQGDTR
jgi:hypothetical protein